jgi:ABC-type phosphate/phosphonate transport system ATPase subunit
VRQRDDLVPGVSARTNILIGQSWSWRMPDWWAVARGRAPSQHVSRLAELAEGHGITDILDERVEDLSGGQRQRVALARALLGVPRLLLADETTSGLDPVNAARAVADLTSVVEATVILSTHDVSLAGSLARVVALRAGRIVHDGAPPDARQTELIYARGN